MFGLGPFELTPNLVMVLKHVDAMRRSLNKLERQVVVGDMCNWDETVGEIRECETWIREEIAETWAHEAWAEHQAMIAFYGKEIVEEARRKREERKRGGAA
jgi:hypothetical protein